MAKTSRAGILTAALAAAALVVTTGAQQAQPPAQSGPVDPAVRARYSLVVVADQQLTARVYEYLELVARRNEVLTRFGDRAPAAELELVRLFERQPRMPWNRRDIGSVNLRINPDAGTAAVEYCLRRCLDHNPDLVLYQQSLDEFLHKIDEESAALRRRWR